MGILRSQLVNMNQHYRRFSLDYFLDCQQRLGIRQIELWCGASHFWLDHEGTGDVPALKQKLLDHDIRVVSVTAPQHRLPVSVRLSGAGAAGILLPLLFQRHSSGRPTGCRPGGGELRLGLHRRG